MIGHRVGLSNKRVTDIANKVAALQGILENTKQQKEDKSNLNQASMLCTVTLLCYTQ